MYGKINMKMAWYLMAIAIFIFPIAYCFNRDRSYVHIPIDHEFPERENFDAINYRAASKYGSSADKDQQPIESFPNYHDNNVPKNFQLNDGDDSYVGDMPLNYLLETKRSDEADDSMFAQQNYDETGRVDGGSYENLLRKRLLNMSPFWSEVFTNRKIDRRRRDIYSLLDKKLRKRYQLETEEDIQRLLVALATIRDILQKEHDEKSRDFDDNVSVADSVNELENSSHFPRSRGYVTSTEENLIDLAKLPQGFPPMLRGPNTRSHIPRHPGDLRNKINKNKQYKSYLPEEASGSPEYQDDNDLELSVRTRPKENKLSKEYSSFYPKFNPTGW